MNVSIINKSIDFDTQVHWQFVAHHRVTDYDGAQTFVCEDGSFGAVFLFASDNTPQTLRAVADPDRGLLAQTKVLCFRFHFGCYGTIIFGPFLGEKLSLFDMVSVMMETC